MSDASTFLGENTYESHPSFFSKDSQVGDRIVGKIVEPPKVVTTPDLNTKEPKQSLVLTIEHSDGELYNVWCSSRGLLNAVGKAVKEATDGGTAIEEGSSIAIEFTGLGTASTPGHHPPKQYRAEYQPAKPSVDAGSLFGD